MFSTSDKARKKEEGREKIEMVPAKQFKSSASLFVLTKKLNCALMAVQTLPVHLAGAAAGSPSAK